MSLVAQLYPALSIRDVSRVLLLLACCGIAIGCDSNTTDSSAPAPTEEVDPVFTSGTYPMSVQSDNDGPLYKRARSELSVDIPFVATDSLILVSDSVEAVGPTISMVPTTETIDVDAYELQPDGSRQFLQTRTLPVTDIPAPDLDLLIGGRSVNKTLGISPSRIVSAEVVARSNPSFAATHPDDALFRVSNVTVTAVRGSSKLLTRDYTGGILDLNDFRGTVEPGDALIFEVVEVRRRNADGQIFSVPTSPLERVIVLRVV